MQVLAPELQILNGRFRLIEPLDLGTTSPSRYEAWKAADAYENNYIVKAWPFRGDRPNDVDRALWDVELRHLFRLTSSPEAESRLVVLKDAGVDRAVNHLVMVLAAPGLTTLEQVLQERAQHSWLKDLRNTEVRREVWKGVRRLALGLQQIHGQHMLHRSVAASAVFLEPQIGPPSMRLGGFELTVRLVAPTELAPAPLEGEVRADGLDAYSFESDWRHFGALASRVLAPVPQPGGAGTYAQTIEAISRSELLDTEKFLLKRLLDPEPGTRLARGDEVLARINEILGLLEERTRYDDESYLALIVPLGAGQQLTNEIIVQDDSIRPMDVERQRQFIEDDLKTARIVRFPPDTHVLVGRDLQYFIVEDNPEKEKSKGNWSVAYCPYPRELRSAGNAVQAEIKGIPIKVFNRQHAKTHPLNVRRKAVPWKNFLPRKDEGETTRAKLDMLHEFLIVTNQIDLLLYDAEIFGYERGPIEKHPGVDRVVIHEVERTRKPLKFAQSQGGLLQFVENQINDDKENRFYLGPEESLQIASYEENQDDAIFWKVEKLEPEQQRVTLTRVHSPKQSDPPERGFLRSSGMFGQLSLVRRRGNAIEKLRNHTYLLRTLLVPDGSYIDTEDHLPQKVDPERIDSSKATALGNIWRTRPVFALQGPPGTGKTTLVANLLGQIFEEDQMAQLLVTAQAHAAVDVLHQRVRRDIFRDQGEDDLPLVIRIPRGEKRRRQNEPLEQKEFEPRQVTLRMLERAASRLDQDSRTPLQERWREALRELIGGLKAHDPSGGAGDMEELVKRSANITFCTTTAGALAQLATTNQSFDWSVIEEAGKAHAFEVVMPLQCGHRWLLIGDQSQLPPYRLKNFQEAIRKLDEVAAALDQLPSWGGGLVNRDFVRKWNNLQDHEKEERHDFWSGWLKVFEQIYYTCSNMFIDERENPKPKLAQMLEMQHRMHRTISDLVSRCFYRCKIESMTVDSQGRHAAKVCHPFIHPLGVQSRAILWLDVPRKPNNPASNWQSPTEVEAIENLLVQLAIRDGAEPVKVAILSPYRRQVNLLRKKLDTKTLPARYPWVKSAGAHTVDSFQGNEAQLVIVSLVRNNFADPRLGLGFLAEPSRMNVLFSRAEQFLVLVGSWDFFEGQLGEVGPDSDQPLGFWRIALDYLVECFRSGAALRLDASSLEEAP